MRITIICILIMIAFSGCRAKQESREMDENGTNQWANPEISFRNHPGIERIYQQAGENGGKTGEAGLQDFLDRINEKFRESELDREEAVRVYEMLHESGILFNEPVGMPDPDEPLSRETVDDLKNRIAIRKKDENSWYIFFTRTSCGFTYFYGYFDWPEEPDVLNLRSIESWRASVPC